MASSKTSYVVITGASGLLGRALMQVFNDGSWNSVTGTAFSRYYHDLFVIRFLVLLTITVYWLRIGDGLQKLDLNDFEAVKNFILKEKPTFLVHAAAQRFPDKVDADTDAARKLNVEATEVIAKALSKCTTF